jgi:hypothetical protein
MQTRELSWRDGRETVRAGWRSLHVLVLAGMCSSVHSAAAQIAVEANGSRLQAQVFDPVLQQWGSNVSVTPGSRVEFRYVVSYTGTSTVPYCFGSLRYQPTFSNADNDGPAGFIDETLPWRNGGVQGQAILNSVLLTPEGESGAALASYGRVRLTGTSMQTSTLNVLTTFRHGGGAPQGRAPEGSWIRLAGSSVTNWPLATMSAEQATPTELNGVTRGVIANQASRVNATGSLPTTWWLGGTQDIIVFRGAMQLSNDAGVREMIVSSAAGSQDRVGNMPGSANDQRFMNWMTSDFGGTYRTEVVVHDARIQVVPSPGVMFLSAGGLACAMGRRRRCMKEQMKKEMCDGYESTREL